MDKTQKSPNMMKKMNTLLLIVYLKEPLRLLPKATLIQKITKSQEFMCKPITKECLWCKTLVICL